MPAQQLVKSDKLFAKFPADGQNGFGRSFQHGVAFDELSHAYLIPALGDIAELQTEVAQNAPHREFDVQQGLLYRLAGRQKRARFLCRHRLAMDGSEPAHLKKPGDALRIAPIRLVRHRLQGALHLTRFHENRIVARLDQSVVQPLRKRSRFQTHTDHRAGQIAKCPHQVLGFAGRRGLLDHLPMR